MNNDNINSATFYLSHGATALKYGLDILGFKAGDELLLPDYICQSIHHALDANKIRWKYYHVDKQFKPDWESCEAGINKNTKGIMMLHYFGIPQDIEKFTHFCNDHKLALIEDNAHGFSSEYIPGKPLGNFGDISICSPWKTLSLDSGAILQVKNPQTHDNFERVTAAIKQLKRYPGNKFKLIKKPIGKLLKKLKKQPKTMPEYWQIEKQEESTIPFMRLDHATEQFLQQIDKNAHRQYQHNNYQIWKNYADKLGLKPVFSTIEAHFTPMLYACYAKDKQHAKQLFIDAWEQDVDLRSWPNLPADLRENQRAANSKRHCLMCFYFNPHRPT